MNHQTSPTPATGGPLRAVTRLAGALLSAAVLAYGLIVARHFFQVADTAIFLATDDGLANVSYALATIGRYGFLSSPVLEDLARDHGLFSYGPFYFYVGAALIWVFGYSLTLLRAIHLGVMVAIAAAGRSWFRRVAGGAAGTIVALGVLYAFDAAQWPMVRPDSFVSLFAVGFVVFAGRGFRHGRFLDWCIAGLSAACGALTHLVAWSLIPAAAGTFALAVLADSREDDGRWRKPAMWPALSGVALGGLVGAGVFYASFGFRFRDQIDFLIGYQKLTGSMGAAGAATPGFRSLVMQHFTAAYWFLPWPLDKVVWATLGAALASVTGLLVGARTRRREALALVAPPVMVWACYFASLGRYNNFHSGYTILNVVMFLWTLAALAVLMVEGVQTRWPRIAPVFHAGLWGTAVAVACLLLFVVVPRSDYRGVERRTYVPIHEYLDRVLSPLPAGARAWGTVYFGIENPSRIQLVQFWEAMDLVLKVAPAARPPLAPDYLLWGGPENSFHMRLFANGLQRLPFTTREIDLVAPRSLAAVFPALEYKLVSMTVGDPYGVTRVYARRDGVSDDTGLVFGSYDQAFRRWRTNLSALTDVPTSSVEPAHLQMGTATTRAPLTASATRSGRLDEGQYLVRVTVADALPRDSAFIVTVTGDHEIRDPSEQLGQAVDASPWFPGERSVYVLYNHKGGAFFVSQFGVAPAAIGQVSVQRVIGLRDYASIRQGPLVKHPITAADWKPHRKDITIESAPDGTLMVSGDALLWGYQALGPVVPVKPGDRMEIGLPVTVTQGRGCIGILDEDNGKWVVPPSRLDAVYEFPITVKGLVRPVLADCSDSADGMVQLKAEIGPGYYSVWSESHDLYTDTLMRAREASRK